MPEQYINGTVVGQREWCKNLYSIQVSTEAPLQFIAGQFTKIGLPVAGAKPLMRPYSFVNAPHEKPYEFLYDDLLEEGNLTPLLAQLQPGDPLLVSARPNGLLTISELPPAKHLFLIATGTGIGAFISLLKTSEPWQRFEKIVLYYSVRTLVGFAYRDLLAELQTQYGSQLVFLPIVTRESVPDCLSCRVTDALVSGQLEKQTKITIDTECQFLLCGNPNMIKELTDMLSERGLQRNRRARPGNVTIEKYWS